MLQKILNALQGVKYLSRLPVIEQKVEAIAIGLGGTNGDETSVNFVLGLMESANGMGWTKSAKLHAAIDANGDPIPWYTYPAIDFLKTRNLAGLNVFEYGSGNSTLWWSKAAASVVSVEHDRPWYDQVSARLPANVRYVYRDLVYGGDYCREVGLHPDKTFDVIVIDGRDRVNCALQSIHVIPPKAVVIFDNSDREQYAAGFDMLKQAGYRRIDFRGFTPIVSFASQTSIFYKDGNSLGI